MKDDDDNDDVWQQHNISCTVSPFRVRHLQFSFGTLISFMLLVQFSERYERGGPFNTGAGGGTADYVVREMNAVASQIVKPPSNISPYAS